MTVRSIVDVDLKDERFRAFVEKYNAYKKALDEMPEQWAAVDDAAGKVSDTLDRQTAALLAQKEILDKEGRDEDRRDRKEKEREGKEKQAQREKAKAVDKETRTRAQSSRKLVADSKAVAKNIGGAALAVAKWTGAGIFGGILGGAASFWGIGALANKVGEQRRTAQGLGVSVGDQQSLGINMGRYFDADQTLQNIASAKSDWSKRWAFSAMGVQPEGRDPASLATEMALAAKRIFASGGGSEQEAKSRGLLEFFSMEDLRRLAATSDKDIAKSGAQYEADRKALKTADETQKRWQDFQVSLKRGGAMIQQTFVRGLDRLTPKFGKLTESVAKAVDVFMSSPEIGHMLDNLGKGIEDAATYLSSPKFQSDVRGFVHDFALVAEKIAAGLRFLGIIPDPQKETRKDSRAEVGVARAGGKSAAPGSRRAAMDFFMQRGYSLDAAAGIVANLEAESGLNAGQREKGGGGGFGLAQWNIDPRLGKTDRADAFRARYGHDITKGTDWEQKDFIDYEMRSGDKGAQRAGKRFARGGMSPADAADNFTRNYERPKYPDRDSATRQVLAERIAKSYREGSDFTARAAKVVKAQEKAAPVNDNAPDSGIRAELHGLQSAEHYKTLRALLNRYENGDADKLAADLRAVTGETGIGSNDAVNLDDSKQLARIAAALEKSRAPSRGQPAVNVRVSNAAGASVNASVSQLGR